MNPKEQGKERKELDFGKIEYLISDWDGTLADSMPAYTESFSKTLQKAFGIQSQDSKGYYLSTVGSSLSDQLREGAKRFANVNVEDTTNLEKEFWRNLTGLIPEIIPGAKEFLAQVKRKGMKVDYAIGNEPGSSSLVKGPGLFAKIAEHFGISEDELRQKSAVLGDGSGDIKAGIAVGVPTIGIVRAQSEHELRNAGADLIVNSLESLVKFFQ